MRPSESVNISMEDLQNAIIQELYSIGLKHGVLPKRLNKIAPGDKSAGRTGHVFRKPLKRLSSRVVHLQSGIEAEVPRFMLESCTYVLKNANIEGLFRKAGSTARQREIRALLDEGANIDFSDHHVIDVANTLKFFLRELPEPLLPYAFHDVFLHCLLLEDTIGAVLLVCLLLPRPHLHTLAFIMEFFQQVAQLSHSNKMDCGNLAIIVTPSVMPVTDKVSVVSSPQRLSAHVRIVELLIAHADKIGIIPDGVTDRLSLISSVSNASLSSDDLCSGRTDATFSAKKKRRRSGSLTRMFNGLKKMVGGKGSPDRESDAVFEEEDVGLISSTPDFSTPCVKSAKKRKALDNAASAFSSKKKRDVLQALPQGTALADTPFKPTSMSSGDLNTPRVCPHPNPTTARKSKSKSPQKSKHRRFFTSRTSSESEKNGVAPNTKKGFLGVSNRVSKKQKHSGERHSTGGSFLERSWSAVSSSSWGRKKPHQPDHTRLSLLSASTACAPLESDSSHDADVGIDLSQEEPATTSPEDFVHIPKSEYEALKTRMSAIETRISQEFGNVAEGDLAKSPDILKAANSALAVQTAYEKTLEGADVTKDTSTDQLAKRLSRELKIHRSAECKVIRSPSARKIGSLRRRSRERKSPSLKRELRRNKSWHMLQRPAGLCLSIAPSAQDTPSAHSSNLRRGRPNTIFSGLPHPTPTRLHKTDFEEGDRSKALAMELPSENNGSVTRSQARRASSFHGKEITSPQVSSSKKYSSHVNITKAALLAQAQQKSNWNSSADEVWHDAEEIISKSRDALLIPPTTGRESIAKLRSENAGKVLATAKLFSANMELTKPVECIRSKPQEITKSNDTGKNEKASEVKGPIRFARNTEATQSLRLAYGATGPAGSKTVCRAARIPALMQEGNTSSPRKTGTPRKRVNGQKSPSMSMRRQRLRVKASSPSQTETPSSDRKVKKHSSMKTERITHSHAMKRNHSVPVHWGDSGKENQVGQPSPGAKPSTGISPQPLKETVPLTDRIRVSISPLKDCNRIGMHPAPLVAPVYPLKTPCLTPSIKQPLTTRSPRRVGFTPQGARMRQAQTPLRALVNSAATPIRSPRRQSPRLHPHSSKATRQVTRSCK